ncbi:MAG: class II aldolase/adducin family protein [Candidatus Margulisbacteria bacterium]|nr:class II aldolase/adducin family protein [Candidatus Margulisiibacteriota bacterium]
MIKEFQRIGKFLFQEGLIDSHGGNMSLLEGDRIFITRRDSMLGDLRESDIVEVGLETGPEDGQASRELPTHRAIYKLGKAKAIVHAHSANAIALSITDNKIVPQDAEGLYFYKAAPIVRVRDGIGSEETVRLLPNFLGGENVIAVVKSHGSFAVGNSLAEAYKYTSSLENSCKIIVAIRSSGGRGPGSGGGRVPGVGGRDIGQGRGPVGGGHGRRDKGGYKSAIPPGIGVMDRSRRHKR